MIPFQSRYQWPADVVEALDGRHKTVASAGAGTGKTAFATDKVLRSVARDGVSVANVVCITHTTKAAGELKERLRAMFVQQFRATGQAHWRQQVRLIEQAAFSTIHAFALKILQEHPLEAGLDLGIGAVEEREASELLQEATTAVFRRRFQQADERYAELADRYGWERGGWQSSLDDCLREAFKRWYELGGGAAQLQAQVEANWPEEPETGRALAAVLIDIAQDYERLKAGRLDFADMVRRAARLLRERLDIRRRFQDRCSLLVLDEAQDADALQLELVCYLAQAPDDNGSWPEIRLGDKLLAVGDLKQAIYRFKGADHTQFVRLIGQIEGQAGRRVSLQENRRCHPAIVRFVNALAPDLFAGRLAYRPEHDDLVARRDLPDDGPRVWLLDRKHEAGEKAEVRRAAEADDLARLIAWLTDREHSPVRVYDRDDRPPRVPRFGDIAILFAKLSGKGPVYLNALARRHIPYHTDRTHTFYQTTEVRDALAFLRAVQNHEDRLARAEVLRNPVTGLSDSDWLKTLRGGRTDFILDVLTTLRRVKDRLPIAELLERWHAAVGQRPALACDEQGRQQLANLAKLQELARHADRDGQTLREFVDDLTEAVAGRVEPQAATVGEGDDVVRILTAHGSKGLEFKIVIAADCTADTTRLMAGPVVFDREAGLLGKVSGEDEKLVATEAYGRWSGVEKTRLDEDQRKLLYVAATRARDLLVFSGSYTPTKKGKQPKTACWRRWIEVDEADRPTAAGKLVHHVNAATELPELEAPTGLLLWPHDRLPELPFHEAPADVPGRDDLAADTETASRVLERLDLCSKPTAETVRRIKVTELVQRWAKRHEQPVPVEADADPWPELDLDEALDHQRVLPPMELGTLAHTLLENWDFAARPDRTSLERRCTNLGYGPKQGQIAAMLDRLNAFASSELGQRLAKLARSRLLRELPLRLEFSREGRTLIVEGVADLVWKEDNGWHLLDYKTGGRGHIDGYGFQLACYQLALARAGLTPLRSCALYFLNDPPGEALVPVPIDSKIALDEALLWELGWSES